MEKPQQPTRRKSAQMFQLVERYKTGDQSQKEFCKAHGISVGTFQYWQRKYRDQHIDANQASFQRIMVLPQEADRIHQDPYIEIRTSSGMEIKIPLI
jgi:transposase-like protein